MRAFLRDVVGAIGYPIARGNPWPFLSGAGLLALLGWASSGGWFEFLSGAILCALVAYMAAYLSDIVSSSSSGEDAPPEWPDLAEVLHVEELVMRVLPYFIFVVMPIGVLLLFEWSWAAGVAGGTLLILYLPMALLAVSLHRTVEGFNPLVVIPSIFRVGPPYLAVCVVACVPVLAAALFMGWGSPGLPGLLAVVRGPTSLFVHMFLARVLGLLYRHYQDDLDWQTV